MNAFETNFKVGMKVKVYNPYGSFYFEDVIKKITPKGRYIKVGETNYTPMDKDTATCITRWGMRSIHIIK